MCTLLPRVLTLCILKILLEYLLSSRHSLTTCANNVSTRFIHEYFSTLCTNYGFVNSSVSNKQHAATTFSRKPNAKKPTPASSKLSNLHLSTHHCLHYGQKQPITMSVSAFLPILITPNNSNAQGIWPILLSFQNDTFFTVLLPVLMYLRDILNV